MVLKPHTKAFLAQILSRSYKIWKPGYEAMFLCFCVVVLTSLTLSYLANVSLSEGSSIPESLIRRCVCVCVCVCACSGGGT